MTSTGDSSPLLPPPRDLRWAKRAKELEFDQLKDVRAAAEKWRTGLTAFTAFLATVLAVGAPLAVENVDSSLRGWVGLLLLAALTALALGSWRAMRAAFGTPDRIVNNGEDLRKWSGEATTNAVRDLRWARNLTVAGFMALTLAGAVGYVHQNTHAQSGIVVTTTGASYCGTLTTGADGTSLVVTGVDGSRHPTPLTSVKSVNLKATC